MLSNFNCVQLCNTVDCSLPGFSVHGILRARILERVAVPLSRGLPDPGIELASLLFPALSGGFFTTSTTWKCQQSPHYPPNLWRLWLWYRCSELVRRVLMVRLKSNIVQMVRCTSHYLLSSGQNVRLSHDWLYQICHRCCCLVAKSCPTLCNPIDCSPPGSVHGISQARTLEWVATSFSRGSSQSKNWTHISCIGRWILYHWATEEAHQTWPLGEKKKKQLQFL